MTIIAVLHSLAGDMTSTHDASSWVSDDVGSVETSDGVVRSLLVVRRPRCRPGPGDAGSLDQQAAAGGPARWPGAPLTGPPPAVRPRQSPAEFRAGKADVAVADQAPAPASNSAKSARLPSSSNSAAVTSPEMSFVTRTALRIRITFLPAQVGELGSHFVAHVPIRERDDEIFNGSHGHGVASFGQCY